jgi:hypothetical protein
MLPYWISLGIIPGYLAVSGQPCCHIGYLWALGQVIRLFLVNHAAIAIGYLTALGQANLHFWSSNLQLDIL